MGKGPDLRYHRIVMNINENPRSYECCIIGAGPAGLGAALELTRHGITNILIIDKNKSAGGLARTDIFNGIRFDTGPHRFFTKNSEIDKIWRDTLGEDFKPVSRLTRICYKNKYFKYPIEPLDVLLRLGPLTPLQVILSFIFSQICKTGKIVSFEDWIVKKFGRKLYEIFFKTYTEKVWGIPCDEIASEWASQRIKDWDTLEIIKNYFVKKDEKNVRTLIKEFCYPVLGSGQMYEAMCDKIASQGAELMLDSQAVGFNHLDNVIQSMDIVQHDGHKINIAAKCFFSSIPMANFFKALNPQISNNSICKLRYRAHITVDLIVNKQCLFRDQWIYVHSSDVKMARIANYNNFSKAMLGGRNKTAISVEYFVFETDNLWNASDEFIIDLAINELIKTGLIKKPDEIEKALVVREAQAYPVNYVGFQEHLDSLRSAIDKFINFYPIGRAGMHKYINQDHALISGILAARNYLKLPGSPYALWDINVDSDY